MNKTTIALSTATVLFVGIWLACPLWYPYWVKLKGRQTVGQVIAKIGPPARSGLKGMFAAAGSSYPPERVTFVAYKQEQELELWDTSGGKPRFIRVFPFTAQSGGPGPKLKEGDRQIPEGIYRPVGLNPNSAYHLSVKLNYPNKFDLLKAGLEGRTEPGTNIFIHGKAASIGCIAVGDPAIELLFVLLSDIEVTNAEVIIAPNRTVTKTAGANYPGWVGELYRKIQTKLVPFKKKN